MVSPPSAVAQKIVTHLFKPILMLVKQSCVCSKEGGGGCVFSQNCLPSGVTWLCSSGPGGLLAAKMSGNVSSSVGPILYFFLTFGFTTFGGRVGPNSVLSLEEPVSSEEKKYVDLKLVFFSLQKHCYMHRFPSAVDRLQNVVEVAAATNVYMFLIRIRCFRTCNQP